MRCHGFTPVLLSRSRLVVVKVCGQVLASQWNLKLQLEAAKRGGNVEL